MGMSKMRRREVDLIRILFEFSDYTLYNGTRIVSMGWASNLNRDGDWQYFADMDITNFKVIHGGHEIIFK